METGLYIHIMLCDAQKTSQNLRTEHDVYCMFYFKQINTECISALLELFQGLGGGWISGENWQSAAIIAQNTLTAFLSTGTKCVRTERFSQ